MTTILSVRNICTNYYTVSGTVKAVDDCSISLNQGETLGIAGESGCGKTTLAMSIQRLIQPPHKVVSGSVIYKGVDLLKLTEKEFLAYRWKEIALVLQQSMHALNPMFRISEQMIEPVLIKKITDKEHARKRAMELLTLVWNETKSPDSLIADA
jgi:peptide/nickel transport system ATP-binding protein